MLLCTAFLPHWPLGESDTQQISTTCGLFLQKINVIRDIREDLLQIPQPRIFWPKVVWEKYAEKLGDFLLPKNGGAAVACLNELIANAVPHFGGTLDYLLYMEDKIVVQKTAIPFIMGFATYERCYDNEKVFTSVVKIGKGEAAWILDNCTDLKTIGELARYYLVRLRGKMVKVDAKQEGIVVLDKCIKTTYGMIE